MYLEQFKLLREVQTVRNFQLVLHAEVWEREAESMVSALRAAVAVQKERGGFNDLFPEPLVTFLPRSHLETEPQCSCDGLHKIIAPQEGASKSTAWLKL